ncbi:helix-turn-helix domain-containing protein [Jiulongibacter sp. NS-SX5]|uniref:helix-turn-helix domain-containing protein n=1 Tax=Jiulongibacter sp. NS-SX5 TaxID=3463854 RepID=UPI00405A1347
MIRRYVLHTPFNIYHFEESVWQHPVHNHTYFEIIFILKGKGIHHLNGNSFTYQEGDIFLLGPEDFHSFDIQSLTEFCFIRFNESFGKARGLGDKPGLEVLENLLKVSSQNPGSIVQNQQERVKLFELLAVLEKEYENSSSPYYEIIRDSLMRSIMYVLARNLRLIDEVGYTPTQNDTLEALLMYIKKNIYFPNRLSIEHLAEVFNMAPTYISIFFKKHTGESIKQFITKYKLKLIETRLIYSPLTLSEIAYEFGFTDESHLSKQFKKYSGFSPSEFRKKN